MNPAVDTGTGTDTEKLVGCYVRMINILLNGILRRSCSFSFSSKRFVGVTSKQILLMRGLRLIAPS